MSAAVKLDQGWECAGVPAGSWSAPEDLVDAAAEWIPAPVPGTVASAWRAAGRSLPRHELDAKDWWYRCRFTGPGGPHRLVLAGIATIADVWFNGAHVARSSTMHRPVTVTLDDVSGPCELVVRCAALAPLLAARRPRPRWKTNLVEHQQMRWLRTSMLGRIPGWADVPPPVGLWRPVEMCAIDGGTAADIRLRARCGPGAGGTIEVRFTLPGAVHVPGSAEGWANLVAGEVTAPLQWSETSGGLSFRGAVTLPQVDRWWPHTHGDQPCYEVVGQVGGRSLPLGRVGFRDVRVEQDGGAFRIVVNDRPVFCRGAVWFPADPVSLAAGGEDESRLLDLARRGGMNMLRVPGTSVYPGDAFYDRCDELGVLVWQDCMFAFTDPPDDEAFQAEAVAECRQILASLGSHPSLAVVCGNQEVEEVAAMAGLDRERRATPLFDKLLAGVAAEEVPGVHYVPSNPWGSDPPFRMDAGVCQYFGVGGYLRHPEDARRAGVRFASECLAMSTPPEPATIEEHCGGAQRAGHDPEWKRGVHRDAGRSWDMEDVRAHYLRTLFGIDPVQARYEDAERALELGRAVNAWLAESVFTEWRRPGSTCDGALVLALSDLRPGAGWGLVDAAGRPKAPWYALRRVLAPVALLAVDEGLNGVALHVLNDRPEPLAAELEVALVARGSGAVERADVLLDVPAAGSRSIGVEEVLDGWRDVSYAFRFAPPAYDAVVATLRRRGAVPSAVPTGGAAAAEPLAEVVHLPLGQARPVEADLGLEATARCGPDGRWHLDVQTRRLAQWVTVRVDGHQASDSWFHLPPGGRRTLELCPERTGAGARASTAGAPPRGTVQALNAPAPVPIKGTGTCR